MGLVVPAGIQDQLAQQFAGDRVDDADIEVLDEQQDVGSGMGSPDAHVMQPTGMTQGDHASGIDAVVADAGMGIVASGGAGFGTGGVGDRGGGPLRQQAVRAAVVVGGDEGIEQRL